MLVPLVMGGVCACLGIGAAWRLRSRAACLRAWQRSLVAMHAACAYARSTCAQVLRAGAGDMPQLMPLARAVEVSGADAARLFSRQEKNGLLRPEEQAVLLSVMQAVAHGNREEMEAGIAYALERFRGFCEASEKKRDADAQMYVTLGLLAGVCVFLILW